MRKKELLAQRAELQSEVFGLKRKYRIEVEMHHETKELLHREEANVLHMMRRAESATALRVAFREARLALFFLMKEFNVNAVILHDSKGDDAKFTRKFEHRHTLSDGSPVDVLVIRPSGDEPETASVEFI